MSRSKGTRNACERLLYNNGRPSSECGNNKNNTCVVYIMHNISALKSSSLTPNNCQVSSDLVFYVYFIGELISIATKSRVPLKNIK